MLEISIQFTPIQLMASLFAFFFTLFITNSIIKFGRYVWFGQWATAGIMSVVTFAGIYIGVSTKTIGPIFNFLVMLFSAFGKGHPYASPLAVCVAVAIAVFTGMWKPSKTVEIR